MDYYNQYKEKKGEGEEERKGGGVYSLGMRGWNF